MKLTEKEIQLLITSLEQLTLTFKVKNLAEAKENIEEIEVLLKKLAAQ